MTCNASDILRIDFFSFKEHTDELAWNSKFDMLVHYKEKEGKLMLNVVILQYNGGFDPYTFLFEPPPLRRTLRGGLNCKKMGLGSLVCNPKECLQVRRHGS